MTAFIGKSRNSLQKLAAVPFRLMLASLLLASLAPSLAYAQDASAPFQGLRDSDEPVQIEADRLEVQDQKGKASLFGNVSVIQGATALRAKTVHVYYVNEGKNKGESAGPSGNIRRIEASGGVAVKANDQKATASSMVYDTASQMVTMNGNVIISQGPNILKGCALKVNMQTNAASLTPCGSKSKSTSSNGRVRILLTPGSAN